VRAAPVPAAAPGRLAELHRELVAWVGRARASGLDDEGIAALVALSLRPGEASPGQTSTAETGREEIAR
jgi:hypothetical protein